MLKALKNLFFLTETQEKTINLLIKALAEKNYRVGKNEFFYDEGRHHSLMVEITLAPNLVILVHTLFATTDFMAANPRNQIPKQCGLLRSVPAPPIKWC